MAKITLVHGSEEWDAMYIDGQLAVENHSLEVERCLNLLVSHSVDSVECITVQQEWLNSNDGYPYRLEYIPLDVKVNVRQVK